MIGATILVVDDTPTNLELLDTLLSRNGYEVRTSRSGEGALRAADAELPNLILLDVMMPVMDGYETCRRLKANARTADIPVIFLSAKNESSDKVEAFEAGGVDYVSKPFNDAELLSRVNTHLQLHALQKAMAVKNAELEMNRFMLEKNLEVMNEHIIYAKTDADGNFTFVSDAFCRVYGYRKEELLGVNNRILKCRENPEGVYKELWEQLKAGKSWKGELRNRRKDGSSFWVEGYIEPTYDSHGAFLCYTAIYYDINDKKRVEALSVTDPLSGLYNRRHFNTTLPIEIQRSIRSADVLLFVMLDVDYFKQYNDTYGHQEGDKVLASIGQALNAVLNRAHDLTFRLGGEEFGVLCSVKDAASAANMAEKIRNAIEQMRLPHRSSSVSDVVTASLGAVSIDFSVKKNYALNVDDIYKMADDELYKAKKEGRNRVSIVSV